MACGQSGDVLAVAFSDNSLKLIDTRKQDKDKTTLYEIKDF